MHSTNTWVHIRHRSVLYTAKYGNLVKHTFPPELQELSIYEKFWEELGFLGFFCLIKVIIIQMCMPFDPAILLLGIKPIFALTQEVRHTYKGIHCNTLSTAKTLTNSDT